MRTPAPTLTRVLLVLVVAVALVACGDDGETADTTTTTDEATTTSAADDSTTTTGDEDGTTSVPADEGLDVIGDPSLEAKSEESSGEVAYLTDVRLGDHDGFQRIVFEFDRAAPGYDVQYVEPPIREDGSGNEVEVDGDGHLEIRMTPASGVDLSGETAEETYDGPDRLAIPSQDAIVEAVRTGDFEAVLTWVVGTRAETPFAVETLDDPPRLVVDVTDP